MIPELDDADDHAVPAAEKEIYDLKQMLLLFRSLCSTLELPKLIETILYSVMAQMRVFGAGIFIITPIEGNFYTLGDNYTNLEIDPLTNYAIPKASGLIDKLKEGERVYTPAELEALFPDSPDYAILSSLHPSIIVPLILKKRLNGILVLGERINPEGDAAEYTTYEKKELLVITSLAAIAVNNASLVEISSTDMTTHLKFKYYFFNILSDQLDEAMGSGSPLSVIMFDIDFFKRVNDTYGHACGDYVLECVAAIIKKSIRAKDMAARYGGEEFTIMLVNTGKRDAMQVGERIRQNVESHDFVFQNQHLHVTISGGVTTFSVETNPASSANALVDQADKALYISKRNGRNRLTFADGDFLAATKHDFSEQIR